MATVYHRCITKDRFPLKGIGVTQKMISTQVICLSPFKNKKLKKVTFKLKSEKKKTPSTEIMCFSKKTFSQDANILKSCKLIHFKTQNWLHPSSYAGPNIASFTVFPKRLYLLSSPSHPCPLSQPLFLSSLRLLLFSVCPDICVAWLCLSTVTQAINKLPYIL